MAHLCKKYLLIFFWSLLLSSGCIGQETKHPFDGIIDKQLFKEALTFEFNREANDGSRSYSYNFEFDKTSEAQHYLFLVTVVNAGDLLDLEEYTTIRLSLANKPDVLARDFPDIGKRARRDPPSFGPGGSTFGLTFTTSDERYDVRLVVSNLLPKGVVDPNIDIEKIGRMISDRYDNKTH